MPNVLWQSEIFAVAGLDYFKKTLPLVKLVHRQLEPMRDQQTPIVTIVRGNVAGHAGRAVPSEDE